MFYNQFCISCNLYVHFLGLQFLSFMMLNSFSFMLAFSFIHTIFMSKVFAFYWYVMPTLLLCYRNMIFRGNTSTDYAALCVFILSILCIKCLKNFLPTMPQSFSVYCGWVFWLHNVNLIWKFSVLKEND